MLMVSNTSPILNLALIDKLALLRARFGEIWVPLAVVEELRIEQDLPGSKAVLGAREAGWLQVKEVKEQALVQVLRRDLDQGEAEAIALALQVKAEWMLLDERDGRRIAKQFGLGGNGYAGDLTSGKARGQTIVIAGGHGAIA